MYELVCGVGSLIPKPEPPNASILGSLIVDQNFTVFPNSLKQTSANAVKSSLQQKII